MVEDGDAGGDEESECCLTRSSDLLESDRESSSGTRSDSSPYTSETSAMLIGSRLDQSDTSLHVGSLHRSATYVVLHIPFS